MSVAAPVHLGRFHVAPLGLVSETCTQILSVWITNE